MCVLSWRLDYISLQKSGHCVIGNILCGFRTWDLIYVNHKSTTSPHFFSVENAITIIRNIGNFPRPVWLLKGVSITIFDFFLRAKHKYIFFRYHHFECNFARKNTVVIVDCIAKTVYLSRILLSSQPLKSEKIYKIK